jgi:outer membrane protein assembly factor BamB
VRGATRAAAIVAGLALLATGCSGGEDGSGTGPADTASTAPAPAGTVAVRVVDGDTGAPVAGAHVVGLRGSTLVARATSDARGQAEVPEGTRVLEITARRHGSTRARVTGDEEAVVKVYDPRLQSPEYGGGPTRHRHVPAVKVGPPAGPPAWTFDGRTLVEFPPAVSDGLVVFGTNAGRVFALDAEDGQVVWARRQKGEIASSPAIAGGRVYVSSMDGMLTAYGAGAGVPRWQFSTGGSPIESSPLVADGLVYVGAWNGNLYAVDAETGKARWTFTAGADIKGSVALAGDLVVVGDYSGRVHGIDARSGARRWSASVGARFYGGPAVSGDTLVIGDVGGAVLALDARSGAVRWRHSTGGAYVYSTPAIARGVVYVGSYSGRFEALDLRTGAVRWRFDAGGRISGSATVVDGIVYTAVLYRPGEPRRTWGLDAATGAVRYRGDDGRYSPAVAAGRTLYLVGTRHIYAHPAPTR